MALAFYDDYNREDGNLSAFYGILNGSWAIESNKLKTTSTGSSWYANTIPASHNACFRAFVPTPATFSRNIRLRVRRAPDAETCFEARFVLAATTIAVSLGKLSAGVWTSYAARTLNYTYGDSVELMFSVCSDQLMAWVDGSKWCECKSQDTISDGYFSLWIQENGTYIDGIECYNLGADAATVDVSAEPDENGYYTLTLHNPEADWTVGTPGSPTFSVFAGTIISQEVTDTDTAVVLYEPPGITAADQLYDSQSEHYYNLGIGTPGAVAAEGGGGSLTPTEEQTLADLHDFLADYESGGGHVQGVMLKLGGMSLLAGSAYSEGDGTAFGDVLDAVLNTTDGLSVIANRIALVRAAQDALDGEGTYSLSGVQEAIRGTSSRDLTQVYNLIAALDPAEGTDVTAILNAIAAVRTANNWSLGHVMDAIAAIPPTSLTSVLNELAAIRTANNWSLGHVMDAIAAISIPDYSTDLQDLADAVDAIPTNPITDLSPVLTAISNVRGSGNPDLAALLTAINARPTNPITSLEPVLTAIGLLSDSLTAKVQLILDAIAALTPSTATPTAPVWPGIDGVTFGDPINLAQTFAFSGPCDGVLVALTSDPNARGAYGWGSVTQYPRAGYLSFVSDNGDYSDVQSFTFPSNLICVQGMLHADGFIGRARPGATGTVTPWTITAP